MRAALSLLCVALIGAPLAALACPGKKGEMAKAEGDKSCGAHEAGKACESEAAWRSISIGELAAWRKDAKGTFTLLDANKAATRASHGTIPGAVLLSHFRDYDVDKELPKAKEQRLVFYCANTKCSASHAAAERALGAGYTNVYVLPDGIMGWKDAGQPVDMPQS